MLTFSQVGGTTLLPRSMEYPIATGPATTSLMGEHEVSPLVKVAGLQAHLRLLRAFHQYSHHTVIYRSAVGLAPSMQLEYPQILLPNRSVHRFGVPISAAWPSGVAVAVAVAATKIKTKAITPIPPLSVLMAQHTYLLVCRPPLHPHFRVLLILSNIPPEPTEVPIQGLY